MIRRGFWLSVGFGLGIAATRRARQAAMQLNGSAVADRLRQTVDAAIADGKREMHSSEARLRMVLAPPDARTTAPRKRSLTALPMTQPANGKRDSGR